MSALSPTYIPFNNRGNARNDRRQDLACFQLSKFYMSHSLADSSSARSSSFILGVKPIVRFRGGFRSGVVTSSKRAHGLIIKKRLYY